MTFFVLKIPRIREKKIGRVKREGKDRVRRERNSNLWLMRSSIIKYPVGRVFLQPIVMKPNVW